MKRYDVVEVEWRDATRNSGYKDMEVIENGQEYCIMFTVGHLVYKDKDTVILAQTCLPKFEEVGMILEVPRGMVRKITVLRKAVKNGRK